MAVWALGGAYAFLGSLQLSELATMIPRSGGQYVFSRYALGEYPGFIVGWSDWISTSGTTAAVALLIGEFSIALFPELEWPRARRLRPSSWSSLRLGSGGEYGGAARSRT